MEKTFKKQNQRNANLGNTIFEVIKEEQYKLALKNVLELLLIPKKFLHLLNEVYSMKKLMMNKDQKIKRLVKLIYIEKQRFVVIVM